MIKSFKIYCEQLVNDFEGFGVDPEEMEYRLGVKEVYHWTLYMYLDFILSEDRMISEKFGYISFTVRKDFNFCNSPIRIVFDMECLKNKYKVEPFNYYLENIEREVRINQGEIGGIKECIKRVEIFEAGWRDYDEDKIEYLMDYYPDIEFVKMGKWRDYEIRVEKEVQTDGSIIKMKKESKGVEKELEHPYEIPMVLYHATYEPYLRSIKKWGLNPEKVKRKSWDFSESGVIYLSKDEEEAYSFAESSDDVPESYLDRIVVLKVDTDKIDKNKLYYDRNTCYSFSVSQNRYKLNDDNEVNNFEYHGMIPWESIIEIK